MKEFKYLFKLCKTDIEVACMIVVLVVGFVAWVAVFWSMHPMCGLMSIGYYPACISAGVRISHKLECMGGNPDDAEWEEL